MHVYAHMYARVLNLFGQRKLYQKFYYRVTIVGRKFILYVNSDIQFKDAGTFSNVNDISLV